MKAGSELNLSRTLQVLVVGPSAELADELDAALRASVDTRIGLRSAASFREAEQLARARTPDLVCTEFGRDPDELRGFIGSLRALAPDLPFLGVRERAEQGGKESEAVLVEALRAGFLDVIERPVSSADVRNVLPRVIDAARAHEREGRVVVFHSTKGGVGKSTLSVNVACSLALRTPGRVLLIDASLQLGVCAAALDLEAATTLADAARERDRLDETLLRQLSQQHHCGLRVLASPRDPIDAADVDEEALARVVAIGRRAFDLVIVDTWPAVDGAMLTLLDLADRIYLVNQGTVPDVIGAVHLLETLDGIGLGPDRRRLVLNRNLPRFTGSLTAREVGDRLGQDIDHEVPHEKHVLTALNLGEPLILRARGRFAWGRAIRRIVGEISGLSTPGPSASSSASESKQTGGVWRAAEVDA